MRQLAFLLILSSLCVFTSSEVVDNNFSKCTQFFLNDAPPDFTPAGVSVKPICQCLQDENNLPHYFYATLYSTTWKIPVYSAYVFRQSKCVGRCDPWYIEPQLDGEDEPCMRPKGYDKIIGTNQAVNCDYKNSSYDKGHLYPVLHTNNPLSMLATSTLTNAAPQDSKFNQKAWLEHEKAVVQDLKSCDEEAYVVTGVVPDTNHKIKNGVTVSKTEDGVTVSKYYWRATCCKKNNQYIGNIDKYIGKGYWGPDNNGKVQELTIVELQEKLNDMYRLQSPISIFPGKVCQPLNRKRPWTRLNEPELWYSLGGSYIPRV